MNSLSVFILFAIFADFILHIVADILNLKNLSPEIPPIVQDIYDSYNYRRSQNYLRINTRFGWIHDATGLCATLLFWFGKGFEILDSYLRGMNFGPTLTGLLFIGALVILKLLFDLPFTIYGTFIIEQKFGFNQTTLKTFILDRIKGLILGILLGAPLIGGVLAFFEYAGPYAWLNCWIAVTLFTLIIQFVAPTWIMPLFNKFNPLPEGELKEAILAYAQKIGFSLENVFVMDGSKRSSKSNAFFTGFGRHRRIVLFDTLIQKTDIRELVAVLAHEMGHFKKHHILIMLFIGIAHTGILFYLLSLFLTYQPLFEAFYLKEVSAYAGLIFFGMLYTPIEFFLNQLIQILSRNNEYAADRFAAQTTSDPEALTNALKKLSVQNLSNLTPHPFYVFLNYSHPPLFERMIALASYDKGEG